MKIIGPKYLHPLFPDGTEVTGTVCMNQGWAGNCCSQRGEITIQRCEDGDEVFFVYKLAAVPGCYLAYCATNEHLPGNHIL